MEQLALVIFIRKLLGQNGVDYNKVAADTILVPTVKEMIWML